MNFKITFLSTLIDASIIQLSMLIGGWPQNNNNHYRGQYGPQQWGQRPGVPNNTTQPPNGPQWDQQRFSAQSHYHSQQVRFCSTLTWILVWVNCIGDRLHLTRDLVK